MEEKLLITSSMEGGRIEKEEFYEEIEAPKFVDFTVPNHFCPDDRFWFCSRVGCDQKHEEEMDSEAIYKNFVLRVMAARSPNVRFRKAMSRKPVSESAKCPHSAPPKSSKSRIPRLAIVASSISKKLTDDENGKLKLPLANVKPASTPKARVKHVAAKYMTSPRKKKSSPNLKGFRSVRNPLKTSISLPKSKVVSKALVFNSPKKALKKKKASEELATPVTKLCEGVKKLQINSQKKSIARKPFKECTSERKKVPTDDSRRIPSSVKRREVDAKTSGRVKKTNAKTNDRKHADGPLRGIGKSGDEVSDMEIDTQSRCHSLELGSGRIKSAAGDDRSTQEEGTSLSERPVTGESSDAVSLNTQKGAMISGPASVVSAEENTEAIHAPNVNGESEEKGNTNTDDLENQNPGVVSELEDNDDKENASSSIDIRNLKCDNVSKHDTPLKPKVKTKQNPTTKLGKTSKENCPAGAGTHGLKNKKLKPTNPKPFRLRTDERGILKEATLERKANSHEDASTASENSKGAGNGASDNRENRSKKDEGKSFKKDQPGFHKPIKSRYKTAKEVEPKSENNSGKTKSTFLQKQLVGPQREAVARVRSRELGVTQKTETATISKVKKVKQQGKEVDSTNKASVAQKSAAQGKSPATIPREPKFHCLHKPKSCITNQT